MDGGERRRSTDRLERVNQDVEEGVLREKY